MVRIRGNTRSQVGTMSDYHQNVLLLAVQFEEQPTHLGGGLLIEIAGRFVGE